SPYSDTTIVSALASGVTTHEHTITQLPFALFAAVATILLGYIPVAFGLASWLALLSGGGVIAVIISLWARKCRAPR
ncbi:MAG: Na+/H+ antiporter NhaC family protein, partial [Verrucomicrobiota bacterium]|nr:Na+/H+ antiporter NhaC family protein [Verrucomicrobiota bacterium]